jgi:hypothetical protein
MEAEMTPNDKSLKRVIEMAKTLNDKTILQMLEDEKTLPENKGIAIYGSIVDTKNCIDLFLLIEPCKQKGYHFTTIVDFTDKDGEGSLKTSKRGFADSDLDLVLHSQKWTPERYEWNWRTDIVDRLEKNPHWNIKKEAELKEREKYS